jgi:lysozyme
MNGLSKVKMAISAGVVGFGLLTAVLLPEVEGTKYVDYVDIAGVATACTGHTGPDVRVGTVRTPAECRALLAGDAQFAWDAVDLYATVPLPWWEHVAFASFTFNVGKGAFAKSTMLKKLNAGDHIGACNELLKWDKAFDPRKGKKVSVKGLRDRRELERQLCLGNLL